MSKYLHLKIPKPCLENWDKMDDLQDGRFCNSCQKNVIDFTLMSDNDLVNFFKKNTENTCGRLTEEQLNTHFLIASKKIPWLKYFFQVAIPAFLFSAKANAQVGKIAITHKHIVDKKRVKSELAIPQAEVTCNTKMLAPNITSLTKHDEEIVVIVGGIASSRVRKVNRIFTTPAFIKPILNSISVFPNPVTANSNLNIKWRTPVTSDQSIEIYTAAGELMVQQILPINKKTPQTSIDLKQLPQGIYIIKTTDHKTRRSFSQQFIVQ